MSKNGCRSSRTSEVQRLLRCSGRSNESAITVLLWQNRRIYGYSWWGTGWSHSLTQYHQHAWPSLVKWYQVSFKYPKCAKEIKHYKQHHKYKEVERICSIKRRKPPSLKLAIVLATRARTHFKIKVSFRPRNFNHFFPKGQSWKRWGTFWAFRFLGEWLLFCRWCHMHQQVQIVQISCHMYKTYVWGHVSWESKSNFTLTILSIAVQH